MRRDEKLEKIFVSVVSGIEIVYEPNKIGIFVIDKLQLNENKTI